jgi:hypothetical protein
VIALLAVVMIPLAPFALLALGGLAALPLVLLWLKTAMRAPPSRSAARCFP